MPSKSVGIGYSSAMFWNSELFSQVKDRVYVNNVLGYGIDQQCDFVGV